VGESLIRAHNLHYTYDPATDRPIEALRGIDLTIDSGGSPKGGIMLE